MTYDTRSLHHGRMKPEYLMYNTVKIGQACHELLVAWVAVEHRELFAQLILVFNMLGELDKSPLLWWRQSAANFTTEDFNIRIG